MAPQEREEEQTQGFTVSDKRLFTKEGQRRAAENRDEAPRANTPPPPRQEAPRQQAPPRPQPSGARPPQQEMPAADFSNFVAMLAHNVMMFLGHPDPVTQQRHRDLAQAKHTIDMLIMLREKTKGNLSTEEQQLLEEILSQLQMAYVTVSRQVR
jgi:hypothetical protein